MLWTERRWHKTKVVGCNVHKIRGKVLTARLRGTSSVVELSPDDGSMGSMNYHCRGCSVVLSTPTSPSIIPGRRIELRRAVRAPGSW
jgi:hypothetical protein